jgi:hypothetical protein
MPVRGAVRGIQVILSSWAACCVSVARSVSPIVSTIELLSSADVLLYVFFGLGCSDTSSAAAGSCSAASRWVWFFTAVYLILVDLILSVAYFQIYRFSNRSDLSVLFKKLYLQVLPYLAVEKLLLFWSGTNCTAVPRGTAGMDLPVDLHLARRTPHTAVAAP